MMPHGPREGFRRAVHASFMRGHEAPLLFRDYALVNMRGVLSSFIPIKMMRQQSKPKRRVRVAIYEGEVIYRNNPTIE